MSYVYIGEQWNERGQNQCLSGHLWRRQDDDITIYSAVSFIIIIYILFVIITIYVYRFLSMYMVTAQVVEAADKTTATTYVCSCPAYWNSGVYCSHVIAVYHMKGMYVCYILYIFMLHICMLYNIYIYYIYMYL